MRPLRHIKWMPLVMLITMVGITSFQVYWLDSTYDREKRTLEIRSNMLFRETVNRLQAAKLQLDPLLSEAGVPMPRQGPWERPMRVRIHPNQKVIAMVNALRDKAKDTLRTEKHIIRRRFYDTADGFRHRKGNRLIEFLYDMDSLQDSVRIQEIDTALARRMDQQGIDVSYSITRYRRERESDERVYNEVTLGFLNPITYRIELGNTTGYLLKRISPAILLSLFIVGFTLFSFFILYRSLLKQRRLADIKNDFISNITHELKTPIATVSVAIEALRSFNASMDKQRTKEYLDISANELQRLSLLVDKVLKLSMFEKKEIELKYEPLNLYDLVQEVTASLRLQFEKAGAEVEVEAEGDTGFEGDRLHVVSVIFNLVDNALKYCPLQPVIRIRVRGLGSHVKLSVSDNGIGIPAEYRDKVFDQFFRVPTGNLHNAKGYGLGLSYVAHVVKKHRGIIEVDSAEGQGST
ncbi:MAG TPA: HAMP domain-containing sensor histidine kinase, partial [Chitinophagaceae bacterium]|nr:HAMP domain-containing sensor histidine kinase [Chitinophagaceae bacterium]